MAAHSLTNDGRRSPSSRLIRNEPFQLGLSHFWLLSSILFGMLALVAFLLVGYLAVA